MACRDCISGVLNSGTPTGKEEVIHGLPTYIALPSGPSKGLIVFIPDAFGWDFSNNRIVADSYAAKGGYTVYLPEFMDGHGCSPALLEIMDNLLVPMTATNFIAKPYYLFQAMTHFIPWLCFTRASVCQPRILSYFQALRTSPGLSTSGLKIATAGFCWGGKYAILLTHDTPLTRIQTSESGKMEPLVDCVFTAHPSFLKLPKDIDDVALPLSIAVGELDNQIKKPQAKVIKETFEKKKDGDCEIVVYEGAIHGFAIRGDPGDKEAVEKGERAEKQALSWFAKWMV